MKPKPKAIIFDIDDTLVSITPGTKPYQPHDTTPLALAQLTKLLLNRNPVYPRVILVTGRHIRLEAETKMELIKCNIAYDELLMNDMTRPEGGIAGGSEFKYVAAQKLLEKYDIICAFDDDPESCQSYIAHMIPVMVPFYPK